MTCWILITLILNFTWWRTWESNLPILLKIHLFVKGLKTRKLDLLARFEVTVSYKIVHRIFEQLKKEESQILAQAGQSKSAMIAYDNFKQVESIKS